MKILSDRHHLGLTNSLILLFEKRLGHILKFQKGMDWWPNYFGVYPHIDTAKQYLERELEGVNGITLDEFIHTKFDILLCSIPQHVDMWIKLRDLYQPQAKLIFQVGNAWSFDHNFPIKNILASAKIPHLMGFHVIEYHQEFDLSIFNYEPVRNTHKIYSFINCLNTDDLYRPDWDLFLHLEKLLPEWEFKSFGGQCRDGAIAPQSEVARLTKEADYIFHCKTNGDGYGHSIFSAAAVGRPLITRKIDYQGKLAEPLIDYTTSIMIDEATPETIANVIKDSYDTDITPAVRGKNIYKVFKNTVDFELDAERVRIFLDNLQ